MNGWIGAATAALLAGFCALPMQALAVQESDLLPVDRAYVLSARAVNRERVEFTWTIAPGYYLYRHRFSVRPTDAAFKANPLQLPEGEKHVDQFFGKVETYRRSVTAVQTGAAAGDVDRVTFKVMYQGCADAGVCYPPQTRTLAVILPPLDSTIANNGAATPHASPATPDAIDFSTGHGSDSLGTLSGSGEPVRANGATPGVDPAALPQAQAFRVEAIVLSPSELLVRLAPKPGYYLYRDKTSFALPGASGVGLGAPHWPEGKPHHDEHFGEVVVYFDEAEIPLPLIRSNTARQQVTLQVNFQGCLTDGICYPPMMRSMQLMLPAGEGIAAASSGGPAGIGHPDEAQALPGGFLAALLLALLGGLILNLMPCVLPVLSFKALGLAESSRSQAHARAHALWYTAGVLASFAVVGALVLALRGAGNLLGWGFQLQQPWVVGALALLMFGIGLSLSGVFEFGASLAGSGQALTEKSGAIGDFFTGVLAVVVASPCTAPFMAGALGYAFTAPVALAMLVFLALGVGLALPFLLIGFVPRLAAYLPRPGAWMDTLKHWLAYPMYLTAVWLLWVFGKQRGMDAVAVLLVAAIMLSLALWWLHRQRYQQGRLRRLLGWLLLGVAFATFSWAVRIHSGVTAATAASPSANGSVRYSTKALADLRMRGTPVFVDMTADWCITCKVNEKAVLDTAAFRALLQRTGTVYMVGDWTNQDPEISALLDAFHSPGVPLYVAYPRGTGAGKKLPQVLNLATVRAALEPAER